MTAAGAAAGKELIVITSRNELTVDDIPIKNFKPIGEFELPEYELQKLSFPPILQMLDYIQRERFSEVIISTPGPIGLTALLAAKMLNLQTSGIYHTDFPQYVRILTEDSFLESVTWRYMHWFYNQLDTVFVNSEEYRDSWLKRGIDPAKLKIFPRGLDTQLFHPTRRDSRFFEKFGAKNGEIRLLYVGRVSRDRRGVSSPPLSARQFADAAFETGQVGLEPLVGVGEPVVAEARVSAADDAVLVHHEEPGAVVELVARLDARPGLVLDGLLELLAQEFVDRRLVAGQEEPALGIGAAAPGVGVEGREVVAGRVHGERDEPQVGAVGQLPLEPADGGGHLRARAGAAGEHERRDPHLAPEVGVGDGLPGPLGQRERPDGVVEVRGRRR